MILRFSKRENKTDNAVNNKQKEIEDRKEQKKIKIMEYHNRVEEERIKELQKLQLDYEAQKRNEMKGKASHERKTRGRAQNG